MIEAAVTQRESQYSNFYAFHLRWEDDDTNADRDARSFADMTRLLGFPHPEFFVISKDNETPAYDIQDKTRKMMREAVQAPGRSVIMIHYSGHGRTNDLDELELVSMSGKTLAANSFMFELVTAQLHLIDVTVDIIIILDCCYSFLASRATTEPQTRLAEILTAGDKNDPIAFGPGRSNSFTSKLLVEIRKRAHAGDRSVEMADVINSVQACSARKPGYAAKLGIGSVILPLDPSRAVPVKVPTPHVPGLLATFSIHVSKTFNNDELSQISAWIDQLPQVNGVSLKLESVKKTQSMLFIFEASLLSFRRICGLPGITLICENTPDDFSWIIRRGEGGGPRHS